MFPNTNFWHFLVFRDTKIGCFLVFRDTKIAKKWWFGKKYTHYVNNYTYMCAESSTFAVAFGKKSMGNERMPEKRQQNKQ